MAMKAYAGPLPLSPVTASSLHSGTAAVTPTDDMSWCTSAMSAAEAAALGA